MRQVSSAYKKYAKEFSMEGFQVRMVLEKTTKGTIVYKADRDQPVTALYISKDAAPNGQYPNEIVIEVSEA